MGAGVLFAALAPADEVRAREEMQDALGFSYVPRSSAERHPLWMFSWSALSELHVHTCNCLLFFAGSLSAASGSSSGIIAAVLMVAGRFSVQDAIPLSRVIFALGSLATLVLNARRTALPKNGNILVDFNICRLVVPSSFAGIYMGVFVSHTFPVLLTLGVLCFMLVTVTVTSARQAIDQFSKEQGVKYLPKICGGPRRFALESCSSAAAVGSNGESCSSFTAPESPESQNPYGRDEEQQDAGYQSDESVPESSPRSRSKARSNAIQRQKSMHFYRSCATREDIVGVLFIVSFVVIGGVFSYHAEACHDAIRSAKLLSPTKADADANASCQHTVLHVLSERLRGGLATTQLTKTVVHIAIGLPCFACFLAIIRSMQVCAHAGWSYPNILAYLLMGVMTGCFTGLAGVGGGVVFAPFFLLMGIDPAVAVATSSTCVFFESLASSMQYLLTDRVIVSLGLVYGAFNIVAAYMGTRLVHRMQENHGARKSPIMAIIAVSVCVSVTFLVIRLFDTKAHSYSLVHILTSSHENIVVKQSIYDQHPLPLGLSH